MNEVKIEPDINFLEVKLEPVGEMKEEPLDHGSFVLSEPRPRKILPSCRPLSASEIMEFEKIKKMRREIMRTVSPQRPARQCTICTVIQTSDKVMIYQAADKKLFIMIGMVLSGKKTVEEAQGGILSSWIHVCNEHVTEALLEIYKVLNIRNVDEMHLCSTEKIQNLMAVVNQLSPQMLFVDFLKFLWETIWEMEKLDGQLEENNRKKIISAAVPVERNNCFFCNGTGNNVAIDSKSSKLVIIAGLVLGGSIAVKHALPIISKSIIHSCKIHLSKSKNEIFKVLEISHIDEMHSKDNREKLMITVNSLDPDISFAEFYEYLSDLVQMLTAMNK